MKKPREFDFYAALLGELPKLTGFVFYCLFGLLDYLPGLVFALYLVITFKGVDDPRGRLICSDHCRGPVHGFKVFAVYRFAVTQAAKVCRRLFPITGELQGVQYSCRAVTLTGVERVAVGGEHAEYSFFVVVITGRNRVRITGPPVKIFPAFAVNKRPSVARQ
ncbi:MAG: hypothetical protein ACK5U7_15885 [Bacteroidota bacterium]